MDPSHSFSKNDSEVNSLAGQAVGGINAVEPAKKIVDDMVSEACGGPYSGGRGPRTFWKNQKSDRVKGERLKDSIVEFIWIHTKSNAPFSEDLTLYPSDWWFGISEQSVLSFEVTSCHMPKLQTCIFQAVGILKSNAGMLSKL